ncbi:e3 ubiquitin ligase big brother [Quercus suber]|uniref:E3 ubiquitin ligase big brother n=1 Tax=Quercus suber TaxID=58331 RepID=A0AAW0MCB8_QUESU
MEIIEIEEVRSLDFPVKRHRSGLQALLRRKKTKKSKHRRSTVSSGLARELLDLGEAVGTQSRGLSQDLINLLPNSKYKFKNLFSAKKARKRCVVCQMRYKRGDRQIKLPCKHVYHSDCITKWLSINKICPICNTEVFG